MKIKWNSLLPLLFFAIGWAIASWLLWLIKLYFSAKIIGL